MCPPWSLSFLALDCSRSPTFIVPVAVAVNLELRYILMLTLIPCMCISPLNGVHSSFSLEDSGSSIIFPLRDDKTSPDPDDMPSSWISLKHSRYLVTLRPHDFVRLYFAMFCGQQSWSDRSLAWRTFSNFDPRHNNYCRSRISPKPQWQWQIYNNVIIFPRVGN